MSVTVWTVLVLTVLSVPPDEAVEKRLLFPVTDNYVQSTFHELEMKIQELQNRLDNATCTCANSATVSTGMGQSQLPTTPVPLTNTPLQTKVTPVQSSTAAVRSSTTPDQSSTTPVQSYTGQGQSASGQGHGATYIRWGMTSCPSLSTSVYTGYAAGKHRHETGSGANILCLHKNPVYDYYLDGNQDGRGRIYGAEYEPDDGNRKDVAHNLIPDEDNDKRTPCTVCQMASHRNVLMVPGVSTCDPGWTLEYSGHVMSAKYTDKSPTEYVCVDGKAEYIPSTGGDSDQHLLYPVEGQCGSLPCPPFVNGREMTCAVCSN